MNQQQPTKNIEGSQCGDNANRGQCEMASVGIQIMVPRGQPLTQQDTPYNQPTDITFGKALEASARMVGHKPVDYSDAAAIQAIEVRATGCTNIVPGGIAAAAQSAADRNASITNDDDKTKLGEILSDASLRLPSDKPVMRGDAEGVIGAELRNAPNLCTHPRGIAASITAAARINHANDPNNTNN